MRIKTSFKHDSYASVVAQIEIVYHLFMDGASVQRISRKLSLSVKTVEWVLRMKMPRRF